MILNQSESLPITDISLPRELLLLTMTVSMGMLIFAGLGYALEKDEPNTMFYTLPQVGQELSPNNQFKPLIVRRHSTGRLSL